MLISSTFHISFKISSAFSFIKELHWTNQSSLTLKAITKAEKNIKNSFNMEYLLGRGKSSGWVKIRRSSGESWSKIRGLWTDGNGTSSSKWLIYLVKKYAWILYELLYLYTNSKVLSFYSYKYLRVYSIQLHSFFFVSTWEPLLWSRTTV